MGVIGSQIIFQMGTVGAKTVGADMLMAAGAVAALLYKMNEVRGAAEKFANQYAALDKAQREVMLHMDQAGKGMADTGKIIEMITKTQQAGVTMTKELGSAMVRLASTEGLKLGESYEEIQKRLDKLTDAISKGQSRALKAYGIDLVNTEDLLLAQAEATDKVIERAQGLEPELKTLTHQMDALNNNWDTGIGLAYDWLGNTKSLPPVIKEWAEWLGEVNTKMVETDGLLLDIVNDEAAAALMMGKATAKIRGNAEAYNAANAALQERIRLLKQERDMQMPQVAPSLGGHVRKMAGLPAMETEQKGETSPLEATLIWDAETTTPRRGGGGGARQSLAQYLDELNRAKLMQQEMQRLMSPVQMGADMGQQMMEFSSQEVQEAGIDFLQEVNKELRERIENENTLNQTKNERLGLLNQMAGLDPDLMSMAEKQELWDAERQHEEERRAYERERMEYMTEYSVRHASQFEIMLGVEQQYIDASAAMWNAGLQGKLQQASTFFGAFAQLQNVKGRAMFEIGRAAAISETWVNGLLGSIKAYQAMCGIPYVGPALGAAAAAAVLVATAATAAQIARQKYGSKGGGAVSVGAGGGVGAGAGGGGAWQGGGGGGTDVTINVQGSMAGFWDTVVDKVSVKVSNKHRTGEFDQLPGRQE